MACHQHHNHHSPSCCCSHRHNSPPQSPHPPPVDPILLQSIVSQLLQNPQISDHHSAAAVDLHPRSSHHPPYHNRQHPNQKQPQPHRQQFTDQFHDQYSVLTSLLQRIDVLESSLHRCSPAPTPSLRQLAARTIQIHFRAHLVRRSRALRELKALASIKSALTVLKSSLSLHKGIDSFSLSREALNLITQLETIQSCDRMVRDSKSSIRGEIGRFLEQVDEISAKRSTISPRLVRRIKIASNDVKSRVSKASTQRNRDIIEDEDSADSDDGAIRNKICTERESSGAYLRKKIRNQPWEDSGEKKLFDELRERVERIQHMSKALKEDEDGDPAQVIDIHEDEKVARKRVYGNTERKWKLVGEENDEESGEGSEFEDEDEDEDDLL